MPLSPPAARQHLHTRTIRLDGYQREDGLYDIEAEIMDTKTYGFETIDHPIPAGEALHHMKARLTMTEAMEVVAAEAETLASPFFTCGGGAESFGRLVGLVIQPGFLRSANHRLGGTQGCTHLRELLQQMATVAMQTMYPIRAAEESQADAQRPPKSLNSCHAYVSDGPVVQRRFPAFYTGT